MLPILLCFFWGFLKSIWFFLNVSILTFFGDSNGDKSGRCCGVDCPCIDIERFPFLAVNIANVKLAYLLGKSSSKLSCDSSEIVSISSSLTLSKVSTIIMFSSVCVLLVRCFNFWFWVKLSTRELVTTVDCLLYGFFLVYKEIDSLKNQVSSYKKLNTIY